MEKVTIIIPTHNRPDYLQRLLDYYHKYGSDFDIIVADSSSEENKKINKKIILSFSDLNIRHIDKYPEEIAAFHKFSDVVNYVKEKYCVFCADDDFLTPDGINQSVAFLEKNPDFTLAHGLYVDFWLKAKKRRGKQFFWGIRYTNQSIVLSDPKTRLVEYLSKYSQGTICGVHRTDFLKMIYKEFLESKVDPFLFGEMLISALTLVYGKMKCLDVLYMARQLVLSRPTLMDFTDKGKYDADYSRFKQCLVVHLHKKSQLSIEESRKIIDDAVSINIKRDYSPNLMQILTSKMKYILNSLHIPDWIYEKIRLLHKKLFLSKQMNAFYTSLNDPSSKYYGDFDRIRSQVISSFERDKNKFLLGQE